MNRSSLVFLLVLLLIVMGTYWFLEYGLDPLPVRWGWRRWWPDYEMYEEPSGKRRWYEWRKLSESIEDLARSNREMAQRFNAGTRPVPPRLTTESSRVLEESVLDDQKTGQIVKIEENKK